jgi:transcriptional regulator with PAS, ATPase and Fis domain
MIFGSSPAMRELETITQRTRESGLPVLITGESGTGKELLARTIHLLSQRRDRPFVAQNCSAIPEGLLEADLFGYRKGAFSGAERSRTGFLFAADGGTFYLDAVESLSPGMQVKLLRVVEEGMVRPVGGEQGRRLDLRIVASSQRDLKDAADRGEFRRDLYFRLAGICVRIPPLRERTEDVPLLVERFLRDVPGPGYALTPAALRVLKSHTWPGNVRELESVVRRLSFLGLREIGAGEVTRILGMETPGPRFPRWIFEGKGYDEVVSEIKREYLIHLFERHAGDLDRMAKVLSTSKRNLYLRLKSVGIRPEELRLRE